MAYTFKRRVEGKCTLIKIIGNMQLYLNIIVRFTDIQLIVNPPLTGYEIGMNNTSHHQFQEKGRGSYGHERKKSKKIYIFEKLLKQMNQNPHYDQSRQSQRSSSRGIAFTRTWNQKLANWCYTQIIDRPNPSEKTTSESS